MAEGVLVLDKPTSVTSHDMVNLVRRLYNERRVGHAGTLDPLATGVLVLCVGRATRLVEYLMGHRKQYEAVIRLGQTTTTYDAQGAVVEERPVTVSVETARATLATFLGEGLQIPPMYSALKQGGQPLYRLARQGLDVARYPRPITLYALELTAWQPPVAVVRLVCSAGVYVRSLAHDWGAALGCGAHVAALRRLAVGPFQVDEAWQPQALTPATALSALRPTDTAVSHLPAVQVDGETARALCQGRAVCRPETDVPFVGVGDVSRAYGPAGVFLGILRVAGDQWQPHKMWCGDASAFSA